jgi:hypothetical protein
MKETFDVLLVMLDEMKRAAIQSYDYYEARNYQRIQTKIIELQEKYNKSLEKEPATAKNTEMTALEYLKEYYRMCDSTGKSSCTGCLMNIRKGNMACWDFRKKYPEQAISIVQQWHKNHPKKTIKDDFFEKFPNANKLCDGIPDACAAKLGYVSECPYQNCEDFCKECWNEPLDEVK